MGQAFALPTLANPNQNLLDNTILILPISSLSEYEHLGPWIDHVATNTTERLLVILVSSLFDVENGGINPIATWKPMEQLLSFVYTRASTVAVRLDRVLMRIDVVLHTGSELALSGIEREKNNPWDSLFIPEGGVNLEELPYWIAEMPYQLLPRQLGPNRGTGHSAQRKRTAHPRYPVVALGGTFDHLHAGHKILLSMAAWIAARKIIVGVTDDALLGKKSNRALLESIERRMEGVREFLELFRPQIEHDIVPISDVYGPTATDSDIQALVVSKETIAGGRSIGTLRAERKLPALEIYVIDVISGDADQDLAAEDDSEKLRTAKMGSTYIREWIAKRDRIQ